MKTAKEVKTEITRLTYYHTMPAIEEAARNAARTQIKALRTQLAYLETEPREDYVKSEIKRLGDLIHKKDIAFLEWCRTQGKDPKYARDQYRKLNDLPRMEQQFNFLNSLF